jgi:hypothetical protein
MPPYRFKEFARLGALVRLRQLDEEERQIFAAYPDLKPKRRELTDEQRERISQRMKQSWAKRKGKPH